MENMNHVHGKESTPSSDEWDILTETDSSESQTSWSDLEDVEFTGSQPETLSEQVRFGGIGLPREALGEDKVLVTQLAQRPKFDIIGRRRDQKILSELSDPTQPIDGQNLSKDFTPSVAALFVERLSDSKREFIDHTELRLFEALPLETQENLLSSERIFTFIQNAAYNTRNANIDNKTLAPKLVGGLIQYLNTTAPNPNHLDTLTHHAFADDEQFPLICRANIFELIPSQYRTETYEALTRHGGDRLQAATVTLDSDYFYKQVAPTIDKSESENINLMQTLCFQGAFMPDSNNQERVAQYNLILPPSIRQLAAHINLQQIQPPEEQAFTKITETQATSMLESLTEQQDILREVGIDAQDWITSTLTIENSSDILRQAREQWPLSPNLATNLKMYFKGREDFEHEYGHIDHLEDLANLDYLLLKEAQEALNEQDYDCAREKACEYVFGGTPEDLGRDLLSIGAITIVSSDGQVEQAGAGMALNRYAREHMQLQPGDIGQLCNETELTDNEKLLLMDAISFLLDDDRNLKVKLEAYARAESPASVTKFNQTLTKMRDRIAKTTSHRYSEYIKTSLANGLHEHDSLDYQGRKIPLLEMEGDDFMLLIHRLGAYYQKDKDSPNDWNTTISPDIDRNGNPVGYISTSAISRGAINLAVQADESITDPDEIFYAFTDFGESGIKYMVAHDAFTIVSSGDYNHDQQVTTIHQDHFYRHPQDLIRQTKQHGGYNEVVLDRYAGDPTQHEGRLQPNYLVAFTDDSSTISERVKNHADYFGIPIITINPTKYQ